MKIEQLYSKFLECKSVSTDTRKIEVGAMYFALKGENFDGNTFAHKAKEQGAKYCVIDDAAVLEEHPDFLLVNNVLETLQELSKYHRQQLKFPIIGLTGSNGKTTTKELICAVLSQHYKVKATKGNLNNHIGVPLTLLSFTDHLDFGIVEMGANHQKEIAFLCRISQPDYGLITNFGKAHLEGFGSIEGVIKGKSELYDYLKNNSKTAIINVDDQKQVGQIGDYGKKITFGQGSNPDFTIKLKEANPYVTLNLGQTIIESQLIGDYNFGNIAVACCIGQYFKLPDATIKSGIENYHPKNNRSEIIRKGTQEIILDAYNANPTSMKAALSNFKQLNSTTKFLFLGDMFELGKDAEIEHQHIVDFVESQFEKQIYLVGANFYKTKTKKSTLKFATFEDLKDQLNKLDIGEASILIKGSRGMALERILEVI